MTTSTIAWAFSSFARARDFLEYFTAPPLERTQPPLTYSLYQHGDQVAVAVPGDHPQAAVAAARNEGSASLLDDWMTLDLFQLLGEGRPLLTSRQPSPIDRVVEYVIESAKEDAGAALGALLKIGAKVLALAKSKDGPLIFFRAYLDQSGGDERTTAGAGRLRMAAVRRHGRIWWAPRRTASGSLVYAPWPFAFTFADPLINGWMDVPAPRSDRVCLIAEAGPNVVAHALHEKDFADFDLGKHGSLSPVPTIVATNTAPPEIAIKLALRERPRRAALGDRIVQVVQEIARRRKELEQREKRLQDLWDEQEQRGHELKVGLGMPRRLFMYRWDDSGLPHSIQQALVQWPQVDLGMLRCRHVTFGQQIAVTGRLAGERFMVLTTQGAVQKLPPADDSAGVRLQAMRGRDERAAFELDEDWAAHGLMLFLPVTPGGQTLQLSPAIEPSEKVARRLMKALAGAGAKSSSPDDGLHVLLPSSNEEAFRILQLDPRAFINPEEHGWDISAQLDQRLELTALATGRVAADTLTTAVNKELETAANQLFSDLTNRAGELLKAIQAQELQLKQASERLHDGKVNQLVQLLEQAHQDLLAVSNGP